MHTASLNVYRLPKDEALDFVLRLFQRLKTRPVTAARAIGNPRHLIYNLLVSNVPGPREELYFHGAQVEALYPCSVIFHGYPLNLTARGYRDRINVGIVGACGALPHFERIATYLRDAFDELEEAFK